MTHFGYACMNCNLLDYHFILMCIEFPLCKWLSFIHLYHLDKTRALVGVNVL